MGVCTSKNSAKIVSTTVENRAQADIEAHERINNSQIQNGVVTNRTDQERPNDLDTVNNNSSLIIGNVPSNDRKNSIENSSTSKSSKDERNVPELTNNSSVFQASLNSERCLPRAVAFDVFLDGDKITSSNNPRKLKKLENAPILTAEQLEKKLIAAEEKRKKHLEKRAKKGSTSSKRRKELLKAQELDWIQQQNQQQQEKLIAAERSKARLQSEIVAKQRRHDAKVRRVRAKARKLHDDETGEVDFVVDTDDRYNVDSEDEVWSDEDNVVQVVASVNTNNEKTQIAYW